MPFYQLVTRCALHSLLPQIIITHCVHYSIFQLVSPAFFQSGPTDDEGEPGGHRGELCCTRPEDEEGFQINIIIVWAGPGVIKTWTNTCWPESTEGQQGLKFVLFVCASFALFFASAFLSLRGMLRVGKDWKTQKKTKHTSPAPFFPLPSLASKWYQKPSTTYMPLVAVPCCAYWVLVLICFYN